MPKKKIRIHYAVLYIKIKCKKRQSKIRNIFKLFIIKFKKIKKSVLEK